MSLVSGTDLIEVTLLGHAGAILQGGGACLYIDPHFAESYSAGLFETYPPRRLILNDLPSPDAIFLSHRHRDHFNLASLNHFKRSLPIICPDDLEIIYGLQELGFNDINVVSDWAEIQLKSMNIIVTPSCYPVPEHGLLVRVGTRIVWHLVDTIINHKIIAETITRSGLARVNLLIWPYQPLKEVNVIEGDDLSFPTARFEACLEVAKLVQPEAIVPYADGQIGRGIVDWINHYRFPVSPDEVIRFTNRILPNSKIISAVPGIKILIDKSNINLSHTDAIRILPHTPGKHEHDSVAPVVALDDKAFHLNFPSQIAPSQVISALNERLVSMFNSPSFAFLFHSMRHIKYMYDVEIVREFNTSIFLRFDGIMPSFQQLESFERSTFGRCLIRMPLGVLERLLDGRIHFISAYLGGLFRTTEAVLHLEYSRVVRPPLVASVNTPFADGRAFVLSPARWFNALLAQDSNLWKRVLDFEIAVAKNASYS